jgi:hypothetical protein
LNRQFAISVRSGLVLLAAQFSNPVMRGGTSLALPLQLQVTSAQPHLEATLVLQGQPGQARITQPLGPAWYASQDWTASRTVRVQPHFAIPGTLAPGAYQASLEVGEPGQTGQAKAVQLGRLTVQDRPHRFDVPNIGKAANVDWGEGIRLVRSVIPTQAGPGESLPITLVWQASRPTAGNWKVFLHLVDTNDVTRAQADAYPMSGSALTPTWKPGEVLVDSYTLKLPADLTPGQYALRLGFYDEQSGERLPLATGSDNLTLPAALEVTTNANGNQ